LFNSQYFCSGSAGVLAMLSLPVFSFLTIAPEVPCHEAWGLLEVAVLEGKRGAQQKGRMLSALPGEVMP